MQMYIWVPLMLVISTLAGYFGYRSNQGGGIIWSILLWCIFAIPTWNFIVKYSNNIVRDHIIFNMIIVVAMNVTTMYLMSSDGVHFTYTQYLGLGIAIFGIFLFQMK